MIFKVLALVAEQLLTCFIVCHTVKILVQQR